jgi:hypothetical protein
MDGVQPVLVNAIKDLADELATLRAYLATKFSDVPQ